MFLWFQKGDKGRLVARVNGKIALIESGNLEEPGLAEVEIVGEQRHFILVRVLEEAAMLEMPLTDEVISIRLKTARRLFGPYDVRTETIKGDEFMVTFYWRGLKQDYFESCLQNSINQQQVYPRRK